MDNVKLTSILYTHTSDELEKMKQISELFSPKLIDIVYKSFGVDYTLSPEELDYVKNYPLFNVNDVLESFGVKKGLSKGFNYKPHFLKDFIIREYKKIQKLIENDFKEKGIGLNIITGNNHKEKIAQRNKRQAEFLEELDGEFFTSGKIQKIENNTGGQITGLLDLK